MAAPSKTTTARGLGWRHQQQRTRLLRQHKDGTPCYWCNQPMYREPTRNWDGRTLEADHTHPRSHGGHLADRLLHGHCNSRRQDGRNDHQRPAITGKPPHTKPHNEQQHRHQRQQWCRLNW